MMAVYILLMSIASILLRVVLCLGLLANGAAQAMPRQNLASSGHAPTPVAPCHDAPTKVGVLEAVQMHGTSIPHHPDCCKAATCQCACPQGPVAALTSVVDDNVGPGNASPMTRSLPLYVSPPLGRLIRPPIV